MKIIFPPLLLLSILFIGTGGCNSTTTLLGTVEVDGSSTVFPITEAVAEEFSKRDSGIRVNVAVSGTGGGFKRFTLGETDINNASRPMKDKESEAALNNGIDFLEMQVGTDGLSVMVDPSNTFAECLTVEELKKIWEPNTKIEYWDDLNLNYPHLKLHRFGPDTDSGTFDFFTEAINGESQVSTDKYQASTDDNVLVRGIGGTKGAIGYFGYAYYEENKNKLKVIGVDGGAGCMKPSTQTIADGSYVPLSRPLFIYVNKASLKRPAVRTFVEYYLEVGRELTGEVGYVAASKSIYQDNQTKLLEN